MQTSVVLTDSSQKIFLLIDKFSQEAAQEQAEKKKLDAFGFLTKMTLWNRPSPESVVLDTWQRRLEPFWHISARREIDYIHETTYPVQIANSHALKIQIEGRDFEVTSVGGKNHIAIPAKENCHRKTDITLYQSAIERDLKPSEAQGHIDKYRKEGVENMSELEDAVPITKPLTTVLSTIKAKLATTSVDAHTILSDSITFEKAHLHYRPVFAFKFVWDAGGKAGVRDGVVEVDALSGETLGGGEWMRERISNIVTVENAFDLSADVAGMINPAAGMAVKYLGKVIKPK